MNTDSVERHASVSDLRPPWGADACIKSASAEAHTEFAHRLPDAVTEAGTGCALRVMRIARTAQKKPTECGHSKSVRACAPYLCLNMTIGGSTTFIHRIVQGERYPRKAGIWEFSSGGARCAKWESDAVRPQRSPVQVRQFPPRRKPIRAGEKLPEKKSRGINPRLYL